MLATTSTSVNAGRDEFLQRIFQLSEFIVTRDLPAASSNE
jgi:hypothetical protein